MTHINNTIQKQKIQKKYSNQTKKIEKKSDDEIKIHKRTKENRIKKPPDNNRKRILKMCAQGMKAFIYYMYEETEKRYMERTDQQSAGIAQRSGAGGDVCASAGAKTSICGKLSGDCGV